MNTWKIDPMHSEVQFKVKHLMISTVTGEFSDYTAELETVSESSFEDAKITFSAKIDSLNTGNKDRDGHLKSADFFDAETYPKLSFVSTSLKSTGTDKYKLIGDLTIKNVTKPVELNVEFGGKMVDFYNNEKAGFEITGNIDRKLFGLTWDAVTEAGGVVVGDQIRLFMNIQMQKA